MRPKDPRRQDMVDLWNKGHTHLQVAEAFGVSTRTVNAALNELGRTRGHLPKPRGGEARDSQCYARNTLRKYGVSVEAVVELWEQQGRRCAICRDEVPKPPGKVCVDHCHKNGYIRGLLCYRCNIGLGQFRDRLGVLRKAYFYLTANLR